MRPGTCMQAAGGAAAVALAAVAAWTPPLAAAEIDSRALGMLLLRLFVLALVIERSLEVYVNTCRAAAADRLWQEESRCRRNVAQAEEARREASGETARAAADEASRSARAQLRAAVDGRIAYRAATRARTLWASLLAGLALAALGVRILAPLVPTPARDLDPWRAHLLAALDALLTGGLLAGGSEGVHKLTAAVTAFLDARTVRQRGNVVS